MEGVQTVSLDPTVVLADDNSRFNLKRSRIDSLKAAIVEAGEVLQPVEVQKLAKKDGGKTHRLTSGFYRHAAVTELNKEGAGLTLPAIVREVDERIRLKHQLSENMDRENMSPMDNAMAIDRLLKAGFDRAEIRRLFARPGQKGTELQPASNAWVNVTLRFLELPKTMQEKIHDGRISWAAAYELGRVSPDKRAAVVERAEAMRQSELDREAKEEEKYLTAERKHAEAMTAAAEAKSKVDEAKEAAASAKKLADAKEKELKALLKTKFEDVPEDGKKAFQEKMAAAREDAKGAVAISKKATNELAKVLKKVDSAQETADERAAALEATRKAVRATKKGKEGVGPAEIQAAAREEGEKANIPLTRPEMMELIRQLAENKERPKVAAFGQVIRRCFDGISTPRQCFDQVAVLTGEIKGKVKAIETVKPKAAAKA